MSSEEMSDLVGQLAMNPRTPVDPDDLWNRARRRRRRRRGGAALGAFALLIGAASVAGGVGRDDATVNTGVASDENPAACSLTSDDLLAPATDVVVYLEPESTEAQVEAHAQDLRSLPEVDDVIVVSREEAYERDRQVFAEVPDFLETISPDNTPRLLEVDVSGDEAAIDDFVRERALANERARIGDGQPPAGVREIRRRLDKRAPGICEQSLSPDTTSSASERDSATASADDPRGAAANVGFVQSLIVDGDLPFSSAVESVQADGDIILLDTSLTDHDDATSLWEALANVLGCDDSFLRIQGWHIALADGSVVDEPGPNFEFCVGT